MAYVSDVAVVILGQNLGAKAGVMGIKFSPRGYKGRLHAAGYPGQVRGSGLGFRGCLQGVRFIIIMIIFTLCHSITGGSWLCLLSDQVWV